MQESTLLTIDAIINLTLGTVLVFFSTSLVDALGLPRTERPFYPSILGAVLVGIGFALLLERFRDRVGVGGLALGGAISINVIGSGTLVVWLLRGGLDVSPRGYGVLWSVAVFILTLSLFEVVMQRRVKSGA